MKMNLSIILNLCLTALLSCMLFTTSANAQNEIVVQNDFEKGTDRWETRGKKVSIKSSKDQAAGGAKSLRVTGRTENWNGTQLNITESVVSGKIYKFTISVKLADGELPDEIKMTLQRGDEQFDGVAAATMNSGSWTTFSGRIILPRTDPYLLIYVEASRANTLFYIDDFKIETVPELPQQTGVLVKNDFEDSTAQNWFVQGENVQMFSSTAGGSRSLKVADRSQKWHGLALDISPKIFKGRTYEFSVSVKLVSGQPEDMMKLTIKQTPPSGDPTYVQISAPTKVTDGEWVTLSGQYTAETTDNNILVYVETEGEKTSFYFDNFEMKIP